jgi:prevent-host-death family protein
LISAPLLGDPQSLIGIEVDDGHADGYVGRMSEYSMAQAKDQLPRLINRMLEGEIVTITRRGRPVARVIPIEPERPAPQRIDVQALRRLREAGSTGKTPLIDTVQAMRDDYRY